MAPAWWPDPIGLTRVIVPIVGTNAREAQDQAIEIADSDADMVEWRADCLGEQAKISHGRRMSRLAETERVVALASILRVLVAPKPLIFTWRTATEGGRGSRLADANYEDLTQAVIQAHAASLVDVEVRHQASARLIETAHDYRIPVIGSWHDMVDTPPESIIVDRLAMIEQAGVDVVKLAVTPRRDDDVTALMNATAERSGDAAVPLVTVAMGEMGLVSRVLGYIFGSQATFASMAGESAPGQPKLAELRRLWALAE